MKRKLFCEISPTCYAISIKKEILRRHIKNLTSNINYAKDYQTERLGNVVSRYEGGMIKTGKGIDPVLQENKAINIEIACRKLDGLLIRPGEEFSFWKTVGKITKRKGYKDGRVIEKNKIKPGIGGGLCNLGNTLHLLVLHSPLDVTEFHSHSDALAPDHGERVPLSAGTSISYNYLDFRFQNNTDQNFQLVAYCKDKKLIAELRSERAVDFDYALVEEDHHFEKEDGKYYRVSKIYKTTVEKATGKTVDKELILDNHSEVMFDYDLIPKELVRQ